MSKKTNMRIISVICCLTFLIASVWSALVFPVAALSTEEKVTEAFKEYVSTAGNNVSPEAMLTAVNNSISPLVATLASDDDCFIYHAVDGVYDEGDSIYPIDIAGHNGYMSATLTIDESQKVGVIATIKYTDENLGTLTSDVYSASNSNFVTNGGNIVGYNGSAEKIVIPAGFAGTINLKNCTGKDNVKAVYIGGRSATMSIRIAEYSFSNWDNLRAVVLPKKIKGGINQFAFANNAQLKYVALPGSVNNSSNGYGEIRNESFYNCSQLENACDQSSGLMPSAQYWNNVFTKTAIRDYYLPTWYQYANNGTQNTVFGKTPSYDNGTTVIMTANEQKNATFARAAVLANVAAEKYAFDYGKDTADTVMTSMVNSYSSKISGVTADWNNTFKNSNGIVSGTLTISYNGNKFAVPFEYNPYVALHALKVEGYEISPAFNPEIFEYKVTVPYSVTKVAVNMQGTKNNSVTGNENFVVGDSNKICIAANNALGEPVNYYITVNRLPDPIVLNNKVRNAVKEYVEKYKNDTTKEDLIVAVNEKIAPYSAKINLDSDYFIYHAADGVYDEDDTYQINILGHDGYVSAIFQVYDEKGSIVSNLGAVAIIPNTTETLGKLSVDVYSADNANFTTDNNGNINGYVGSAEKIVIPSSYMGTINLKNTENRNNVKALYIGGSSATMTINIADYSFENWDSLRAVVLPQKIIGNIKTCSFANNAMLKYVRLPRSVNINSNYGEIQSKAFANNPQLETVGYTGSTPELSSARYGSGVFDNTAIRDYYLNAWMQYASGANQSNTFGNKPTYSQGDVTVLTYAQFNSYTSVKAAGMAQVAAYNYDYDFLKDSDNTVKNAIEASYSQKVSGIGTNWNNTFTVYGNRASGVLTLSASNAEFEVYFDFDSSVAVKSLDIGDYDLNPAFTIGTYEYLSDVTNNISDLSVGIKLAPGAVINSISGNYGLAVGLNEVIVNVTAKNGSVRTYNIKVTRAQPSSLETMASMITEAISKEVFTNDSVQSDISLIASNAVKNECCTVNVKDFYLYKAIGGAIEGDEVLVPGHKGYITAVIELSNGKEEKTISVLEDIEPVMENYTFISVSQDSDFELSNDGKTLITYSGSAEKVVIPEGVETFDPLWFYADSIGLKCIVFPDSLKEAPNCTGFSDLEVVVMGDNVTSGGFFGKCASLKYVKLSENLQSIGGAAFTNTISLAQIYIPQSVTSLETNAFYKSLLRDITISKNITKIGSDCFSWCVNHATYFSQASQGAIISAERAAEIENTIVKVWAYKNGKNVPRTITILSATPELASGIFGGDNTGAWAPNAPRILEGSSLDNYIASYNDEASVKKNLSYLNMGIAESAARAQITADGIKLTAEATADEVKAIIEDSYYTKSNIQTAWSEAFEISGNRITGKLLLTGSSGEQFEISIDTIVFNKIDVTELEADEDTNYGTLLDYYGNRLSSDDYEDKDDYQYDTNNSVIDNLEEEGPKTKTLRRKVRVQKKIDGSEGEFYIPVIVWVIVAVVSVILLSVLVFIIVKRKKIHKK